MADTLIVLEDESVTQDVNVFGTVVDSSIVLATGLIAAGSPLQKSKVIEIQMEYEAYALQTLIFEWTRDGTNWSPYSTKSVTTTLGPTILAVRKTITHHNIQLRVRSTVLGKLRVISFTPRQVLEGKVNP